MERTFSAAGPSWVGQCPTVRRARDRGDAGRPLPDESLMLNGEGNTTLVSGVLVVGAAP